MSRIGTVCYSHSRGLGHLARSFIDAKVIDDIYVVRHPNIPMKEWYPNAPVTDIRQVNIPDEWLRRHSAMLFFETPFSWDIIARCRNLGVRTYLVTMYECSPDKFPTPPDVLLCPSLLDLREFERDYPGRCKLCSIPVEMPWTLRSTALHFVHNGGYLGMRGREGTELLIESLPLVKSPIRLTIRVQEDVSKLHQIMAAKDKRVEYINHSVPFDELYGTGDVAVFPQKFNGMSMPLMEARASGMVLLTTDRYPTNEWLNNDGYLIPVHSTNKVRLSPRFREIEECNILPSDIAAAIDFVYKTQDIQAESRAGLEWAVANSWVSLRDQWEELLSC